MRVCATLTMFAILGCGDSVGSTTSSYPAPTLPSDVVAPDAAARSTITIGPFRQVRTGRPLVVVTRERQDGTPAEPRLLYSAHLDAENSLYVDFALARSSMDGILHLPHELGAIVTLTKPLANSSLHATQGAIRIRMAEDRAVVVFSDIVFVPILDNDDTSVEALGPWSGEIAGEVEETCQYLADAPDGSPQRSDGSVSRVYVDDPDWMSPFCAEVAP